MPDPPAEPATSRWHLVLVYGAFAVLLYGLKLWVIAACGNPTPFWDQWDAEALYLFVPFRQGRLEWTSFFLPHNEHRILTTRLLALTLLQLNGLWNPLLEMVASAAVHVAALSATVFCTTRSAGRRHLLPLMVVTLTLFGLPFGWENTLAGFQAQFYFLVLFSMAGLWLLTTASAFCRRWWGGLACAGLAYFSLASGTMAFAAAMLASLARYARQRPAGWRDPAGMVVLLGLAAAGYVWTPVLPGHLALRAGSIPELYRVTLDLLSWPFPGSLIATTIRNAPAVLFVASLARGPQESGHERWFLLGLVIWMGGQAVMLAYGRAAGAMLSRYLDLIILGVLINFACLLRMTDSWWTLAGRRAHRFGWLPIGGAAAWILLSMAGVALLAERLGDELDARKAAGVAEESNTRAYLQTGDMSQLTGKPFMWIPYPDPQRLAGFLSLPDIRALLPSNLQPPSLAASFDSQPAGAFVRDGYYPTLPKRSDVTLGSYTTRGDAGIGQATLRFASLGGDRTIAIPVGGYPLSGAMDLSVEQAGQHLRVFLFANPRETWGMAYVTVSNGPFDLHLTDGSRRTWLAVGNPVVAGRVDWVVAALLAGFPLCLALGATLAILAVVLAGWHDRRNANGE